MFCLSFSVWPISSASSGVADLHRFRNRLVPMRGGTTHVQLQDERSPDADPPPQDLG